MSSIPRSVLSEHLQERLRGRKLRSAVFLTFQFDPGFFEQEILPVLLDVPLSHAVPVRLIQLDDAMRALPGQVVVFYDVDGLVASDSGSAKLDVRRIPVRQAHACFHPKNVFLLVDAPAEKEGEAPVTSLLVATLSANLTRSGWWENVEVCHVEEIGDGVRSSLRGDLASLLNHLRRLLPDGTDESALREMLTFLRRARQREHVSFADVLHPQFYASGESVPDFLQARAGRALYGSYLEVISPYFDNASRCKPLEELIDRFQPAETRVYLPRGPSGEALVNEKLYAHVAGLPNVTWARLPGDLLRLGRSEDAGSRTVHAKVYRFITRNPSRERIFLGSANLTNSGHQGRGGNFETGILVDTNPSRRPEFWLEPETRAPKEFRHEAGDDETATLAGSPLSLRYHWTTAVAEAHWDAEQESPRLKLEGQHVPIGELDPLPSRQWRRLPDAIAAALADRLETSSFVTVIPAGRDPGMILVLEEGMSHKRSLLLTLSAADILQSWAILTPDQRSAFLEARSQEVAQLGQGADLVARWKALDAHDTMFDRFAGYFHAFGCLERSVREQLAADRSREAEYRLFGKKYDSLGSLLDRVLSSEDVRDDVDRYVILLCAQQMRRELRKTFPEFWSAHAPDAEALDQVLERARDVRARLQSQDEANMPAFLNWFDRWFLARASRVEEPA